MSCLRCCPGDEARCEVLLVSSGFQSCCHFLLPCFCFSASVFRFALFRCFPQTAVASYWRFREHLEQRMPPARAKKKHAHQFCSTTVCIYTCRAFVRSFFHYSQTLSIKLYTVFVSETVCENECDFFFARKTHSLFKSFSQTPIDLPGLRRCEEKLFSRKFEHQDRPRFFPRNDRFKKKHVFRAGNDRFKINCPKN